MGININIKRIFDFSLSLFGIIASFPVWLVIAFLIWLEDGGEIFCHQDRVGKGGVLFESLKFRSMFKDAEKTTGPIQAAQFDVRTTKLGRLLRITAMDELPQLLNILKGDMSFVGPRALRPVETDAHETVAKSVWEFEGFKERSRIQPGLTGIAQILAPRDIARNEKFKYDIWYVKNKCFMLDLFLILLSFLITFTGEWEIKGEKLSFFTKFLKRRVDKQLD